VNSRPKKTGTPERPSLSLVIVSGEIGSRPQFRGDRKSIALDVSGLHHRRIHAQRFRLLEDDADVYTPLGQSDPLILNERAAHNGIYALARLGTWGDFGTGSSRDQYYTDGLDHLYPDANRDLGIYIEPLKQFVVGDAGKMLLLLLGAVGLVLADCVRKCRQSPVLRAPATRYGVCYSPLALGANRTRLHAAVAYGKRASFSAGGRSGTPVCILGVKSVPAAVAENLPRSEQRRCQRSPSCFLRWVRRCCGILFGLAPAPEKLEQRSASLAEGGGGPRFHSCRISHAKHAR